MSAIRFSVRDWTIWLPEEQSTIDKSHCVSEPALSFIPAMMRRRLGCQGKMVASSCARLLEDDSNVPIVFCSRHGEIQRSVDILTSLIEGDVPSPMQFSLSVHNAISGLLSIATGNTSNITAIAAGSQGICNALTEAATLLHSLACPAVLCIIYDQPLPALYANTSIQPDREFALAVMLTTTEQDEYLLQYTSEEPSDNSIQLQLAHTIELLQHQRQQVELGSALLSRSGARHA